MKLSSRTTVGMMLASLVSIAAIAQIVPQRVSQVTPDEKPLMAEDVFKNVQVLKGISVRDFMNTMGFFSASTGLNCIDCHAADAAVASLEGYAVDTPLKQTTRKMLIMVKTLNQTSFGGQRKVTCYTCHRASDQPEHIPSLLDQYSVAPDDPDKVQFLGGSVAASGNKLSVAQILDNYIQAIGGPAQVAKITSFVATGTYEGFETYHEKVPVQIFAQAPKELTMVVHTQHGDYVTTYDGEHGWIAAADKLMRVLPLAGGDLTGAKTDAVLSFPAGLKTNFNWRTGFPAVSIEDKPVEIIQDTGGRDIGTKLYFDKQSGVLVRQVRYTDTAVGPIPTQIDYSDYRNVAGVKMPFHILLTWTDGQSIINLSDIQPNVHIDPEKFAKPAPPTARPSVP